MSTDPNVFDLTNLADRELFLEADNGWGVNIGQPSTIPVVHRYAPNGDGDLYPVCSDASGSPERAKLATEFDQTIYCLTCQGESYGARTAVAPVTVVRGDCLGCNSHVVLIGKGVTADHDVMQEGSMRLCPGSGHIPAKHDERDGIRRAALGKVVALDDIANKARTEMREAPWLMSDLVSYYSDRIMLAEWERGHWARVLETGDFYDGLRSALTILTKRRDINASPLAQYMTTLADTAARNHLRALAWRLQGELEAQEGPAVKILSTMLFNL